MPMEEQKDFLKHRLQKLHELREAGINPYANSFKALHTTHDITAKFHSLTKEEIEACEQVFSIAGRIMSLRDFGKSAFFHLQDRKGRVQAYIQKNKVGPEIYASFKKLDIGDFIGIQGRAFLTQSR